MKYQKFYRILSIALLLSLLMMVIPATPALAYDRDIELDIEKGKIGDEITLTGDDWSPSYEQDDGGYVERRVDIYFAKEEVDEGDDIDTHVNTYEKMNRSPTVGDTDTSDKGEWEITFEVPDELNDGDDDEDTEIGTYYIYVTRSGLKNIYALAEFNVIGGEITIDPEDGPVGTEVEIDGDDFGSKEDITIEYDDDEIDIKEGDDDTNGDGEFNNTVIIIPESTAGEHTIKVIGDETLSEVEATFTVEPEITVSPDSGGTDTAITVSGTGFGYKSDFGIFINGTKVAADTTDKDGSFDINFNMPEIKAGLYDIKTEDEDDNSDTADFTFILTSVTLTPTTGHIGTEVTATGTGFTADTTVTIKYDTTEIATPAVKTDGTFSTTFKVPAGKKGDHEIIIGDDVTTNTFTFTMESTAPSVPTPLSPSMELLLEPPVKIDWEDVTDDSPPVTYELQIATNSDFTALSIELEKKGLTKSEYTLSAVEKLEPTIETAPYYWRIRAVDGAANESRWTGAGSFYVTAIDETVDDDGIGGFKLPPWAKYVLGGLAALLIGFFGFWLGRRTGYYSY